MGLLPFYPELYDQVWPNLRARIEGFHQAVVEALKAKALDVVTCPPCRRSEEFAKALAEFERQAVDALVTLHLAYSPSLEACSHFLKGGLPIIILDTTPAFGFGPEQEQGEIYYNHGIHGVQDFCSVLRRGGRDYYVEAGHWQESDVLDRVVLRVRAARLRAAFLSSRVGLIGKPFVGMGDFSVPFDSLAAKYGIQVIPAHAGQFRKWAGELKDADIQAEVDVNLQSYVVREIDCQSHLQTARTSLVVRKWIAENNLSAFSFNFMDISQEAGIPSVPFLEASKAMGRGVGYAGEGDVLTAVLVGSLASVYPDTSFTEMFCPDWEGNSIFLSHMGEINVRLTADVPSLILKDFPFTDTCRPVVAVGRFRSGDAVLVNLAPGPEDQFSLIIAPVSMLEVQQADRFKDAIRGWFRPRGHIADFLAAYSREGGTHHLAVAYGVPVSLLKAWGEMMGWRTVVLD